MSEKIEGLLQEVTVALQDLVAGMADRGEAHTATAAALQDLVTTIERRKSADLSEVVGAIKALQLSPRIEVLPAPVRMLPAPALQPRLETWDVQLFDQDGKARGRMQISKTTTPKGP